MDNTQIKPSSLLTELKPIEQKFADLVLSGVSHSDAYMQSHPNSKTKTPAMCASSLLRHPRVKAYMDKVRGEATGDTKAKIARLEKTLLAITEDLKEATRDRIAAIKTLLELYGAFKDSERAPGVTLIMNMGQPIQRDAIEVYNIHTDGNSLAIPPK